MVGGAGRSGRAPRAHARSGGDDRAARGAGAARVDASNAGRDGPGCDGRPGDRSSHPPRRHARTGGTPGAARVADRGSHDHHRRAAAADSSGGPAHRGGAPADRAGARVEDPVVSRSSARARDRRVAWRRRRDPPRRARRHRGVRDLEPVRGHRRCGRDSADRDRRTARHRARAHARAVCAARHSGGRAPAHARRAPRRRRAVRDELPARGGRGDRARRRPARPGPITARLAAEHGTEMSALATASRDHRLL